MRNKRLTPRPQTRRPRCRVGLMGFSRETKRELAFGHHAVKHPYNKHLLLCVSEKNMEEKNQNADKLNDDELKIKRLERVMKEILLPTPRPWLMLLIIVIILSLLEVTRTADGTFVINFRLT